MPDPDLRPCFCRPHKLISLLGISRAHYWRKIDKQLTHYTIAGVSVRSVDEALALVKPQSVMEPSLSRGAVKAKAASK
jgi:hypothetical protein